MTRIIGIMILSLAFLLTNCRSRDRAAQVGKDDPKLLVKLNQIDDAHVDDPGLGYRLQCDTNAEWVPGKTVESSTIEFLVKGIKRGVLCDLKVIHLEPPAEIRFIHDDGLLYTSKVSVAENIRGQLVGTAVLSPQFQFKKETYSVEVPVVFANKFPQDAKKFRAQLICRPTVASASEVLGRADANEKSGAFLFQSGLEERIPYECVRIRVQKGGDVVYFGEMKEKFTLKSGDNHKTDKVTLEKVETIDPSGVIVETEPASCPEGEVFDIQTRKCVKDD